MDAKQQLPLVYIRTYKCFSLLVLLAAGSLLFACAGAASYSDMGDVSYKDSWCSRHQYETGSEYEAVLNKLLDDLNVLVAGDSEELWVISDYGLFARAQCSVQDWSKCATCVSFLAAQIDNWCPQAKLARVALADCDIEYAFDTKTTLEEFEEETTSWTMESVEDLNYDPRW